MKIKKAIEILKTLDQEQEIGGTIVEINGNTFIFNVSPIYQEMAKENLRQEMSDISEDYWCAGWLINLEYYLWSMVKGEDRSFGFGEVQEEKIQYLKALSNLCKGWWIYEEFLPIEEWEVKYQEYKDKKESEKSHVDKETI